MDKIQEYTLQLQILTRERYGFKKFIEMGWRVREMSARLRRLDILIQHVSVCLELESHYKITRGVRRDIYSQSSDKDKKRVGLYLSALDRYGTENVTPKELAKVTGISASTWKKIRKDTTFLSSLKDAIQKKINFQKTDKTKTKWRNRLNAVHDLVDVATRKKDIFSRSTRVPYDDHRGYDSVSSDVAEVMLEEGRAMGKSPKRGGAYLNQD